MGTSEAAQRKLLEFVACEVVEATYSPLNVTHRDKFIGEFYRAPNMQMP